MIKNQKPPEFHWTSFWNWFLEQEPDANYQICTFGNDRLPYQWEDKLGFVVATKLTIRGETHLKYEPVRIQKYLEKEKKREESLTSILQFETGTEHIITERCSKQDMSAQITLSDINRAIIQCLFQNLISFK